jgi:hypothetical protein
MNELEDGLDGYEEVLEEEEQIETQFAEENRAILSAQSGVDFWCKVFLDVHDIEHAFIKSKEVYTKALLSEGHQVNPQQLYLHLETMLKRLMHIDLVKRLCANLGLHAEQDRIMERELTLLYSTPQARPQVKSSVVVGDKVDN